MTARGPLVFDGSVFAAGPPTGVAIAFTTTLAAYARSCPHELVLVAPPGTSVPELGTVRVERADVRGLRRHTVLPGLLRRLGAALWHAPIAALPWRAPCPLVATVHDVPWRAPVELVEPGTGWRHRAALRHALRVAGAILVPSATTAAVLGAHHAVRVVPHGIVLPETLAPAEALRGPFLAIGDDRMRKNLERLRAAHTMARAMDSELVDLRVVGKASGYLPEAEKVAALRSARALVHVALFEGFGLPVLEAMAHGVPVLASTDAALVEVAGGAALHVDPLDVAAIARGLVRVHRDAVERERQRSAGPVRAAHFTPERSAELWASVHAELLAR